MVGLRPQVTTTEKRALESLTHQLGDHHAGKSARRHIARVMGANVNAAESDRRGEREEEGSATRPDGAQRPRRAARRRRMAAGERPTARLLADDERAHDVDERTAPAEKSLDREFDNPGGTGQARQQDDKRPTGL